jgi:TPR repeat protein
MRINLPIYIILVLVSATGRADVAFEAYNSGDFPVAAKHYQILSDAGNPVAQNNLGAMYLRGKGVEIDFYKAKKLFKAAAESNLPGAMFNLGIINLRGYGEPKNSHKAVHWFTKGAELGDLEAQFFLAVALAKGEGTSKNIPDAKKWFAKSAEQGLAAAQFNLAILLLREEKKEEAINFLKRASQQNHAAATFQLAGEYLKNTGNIKDQKKAFELMRKLAETGDIKAQMQVGLMYIFANGTEINYEEGYFWLNESALGDFKPAQRNLSSLLMKGIGKDPNLPLSYAWFTIASENGPEESEQNSQVKKILKSSELELARTLTHELKELIQGRGVK